jgi:integrase
MEQKVIVTKDNRPNRKKPWLARWWGEYDPRTGKQRRYCKSFNLRKEADQFAEDKNAEFQSGLPRDQRDITLQKLCKKFLSTRKNSISNSYRRGFDQTIDQLQDYFSPNTSIKNIRQEDCEMFIANLEPVDPRYIAKGKQFSDSSRSKHLRQAKKIFSTAQEWGYIRNNPFKKINLGKIRTKPWHYITVEQFNALINSTKNLRDKAVYGTMYWCGLRYGEAANLLWDGRNINFENNQIKIYNRPATKDIPPFDIKDYEVRTVPMNKWVVDILKKLRSQADKECPFVFLTTRRYEIVKKRWSDLLKEKKGRDWENRYLLNGVLRNFKARCRAAGIKTNHKLTIHCLRKSWASNLANSGKVPAHTLKELGGWSDIRTCEEYYLQSGDANRERACDVLNELAQNGEDI